MIPERSLERAARLVRVTGLVQGVGFRPFVHRLALRHHLSGWVRNTSHDVQIEIEGVAGELDGFLIALRREAPPLARIEAVEVAPIAARGLDRFQIVTSAGEIAGRQPVSPDVAICPACEAELFDPANRRYRYPFITCTDCGPRFTIIDAMPYDRERTSMAAFRQCPACAEEYRTPGDRRHHSETNSCPACGPRLWYWSLDERWIGGTESALEAAGALLREGGLLAVRGLGGFHLAADATDDAAVRRLRSRKHREAKPLAIMVRTLADVRAVVRVTDAEAALLSGPERPIVLLELLPDSPLAPSVAPGLDRVGVMLAYTPLHHLLLTEAERPLVMTSGNLSDEPIAIDNEEAVRRLADIADGFLLHDREILSRYDDSVLRVADEHPIFLRRARGFAPMPLGLPVPTPAPLLAVGPHLKNTFTLAAGRHAYLSQHIGDLESLETLEHFQGALTAFRRLFRVEPEVAVRDLHPGYLSTRVAMELGLSRIVAVQHHHAHVAAVLAEHGETGPALGVSFDGTGYGDDGQVWGGEVLEASLDGYRRLAHLRYAPLPGGDLAARIPWRSALGYASLAPGLEPALGLAFDGVNPQELDIARTQIARRVNTPLASSMGRLFDAAAAVLGVRQVASYEGQAPMELEALAGRRTAAEYACSLAEVDGTWVADPVPLLAQLGWRIQRGVDRADLAADFHASIAWMTAELIRRIAEQVPHRTVVLSGGVFQNARLFWSVRKRLTERGFRVLVPTRLSPGDGAISYGQAAVAARLLAREAGGDPG